MSIDIISAFERKPAPLDFLWPGGGYLAGTVGALVAPGATGKSWWALQAAASLAAGAAVAGTAQGGADILDLRPAVTGKVIYLAGEDPEQALLHRLHSLGQHITDPTARDALAENLTIECIAGKRLDVMDDRQATALIRACSGARLVVLDTLSRVHLLDENSNGDMARLVSQLEFIAVRTGAAVLYLHHVSKGAVRDGQLDQQQAARGASALVDNPRWCGYVARMTDTEALSWSDDPSSGRPIGTDRRGYFLRFGVSKQNYSARSEARWYIWSEGGVLVPAVIGAAKEKEAGTKGKGRAHAPATY